MTSNQKNVKTILAIETAVAGGSVALLRNGEEIAVITGATGVSRAEDLLLNIESLLVQNHISRSELDIIAVSCGPGSYTGIRIGIATALGLGRALSIESVGVSALSAMANNSDSPDIFAAIPFGKHEYALQRFEATSAVANGAAVMTDMELVKVVDELKSSHFIFHPDITVNSELIRRAISDSDRIAICKVNLATLIGRLALQYGAGNAIQPIYLRRPQNSTQQPEVGQ